MEDEKDLETTPAETVDSTNDEVEAETEEVAEETNTPTLEDFYALEKKNKELFERAKKAEALAKQVKQAPLAKNAPLQTNTEEDLIRTAKLASQLDDDDLDLLKTIQGSSIAEKLENPLFKAYKEQKAKKAKSDSAQLKPSGSSNSFAPGIKPGMTEDEHKELWNKMMQ